MGKIMKLRDIVSALETLDTGDTIYAAEPWSSESPAVAEAEPRSGELPQVAAEAGLNYFLEVDIARDFIADWESGLQTSPSVQERCERLIRYAVDDA